MYSLLITIIIFIKDVLKNVTNDSQESLNRKALPEVYNLKNIHFKSYFNDINLKTSQSFVFVYFRILSLSILYYHTLKILYIHKSFIDESP